MYAWERMSEKAQGLDIIIKSLTLLTPESILGNTMGL
jgi:hypothetical protein